ncbi:MAG TPA: NUDIX hydrolase [Thermomicrobiaceae bacterium]|nr:NUDIX hydrolase [Thermomicrobiaceae bacterium]
MPAHAHDDRRFNYRVGGVCLHRGHVLLHRAEDDDFWAMPGGRPEFGEPSDVALQREMREEIGVEVAVERFLWLLENFYAYRGQQVHELACYYLMALPDGSPLLDTSREFSGYEPTVRLLYRWFPLEALDEITLYPTFLKVGLRDLPAHPTRVVHTDEK